MRPATLIISAAALCIAISFSTGTSLDPSDPSRFKIYTLKPPLARPCDLCKGPDNGLWGIDIANPYVFRLDPVTGKVDYYVIPFTSPSSNFTLPPEVGKLVGRLEFGCGIRPGYNGRVYFVTGFRGQLGEIDVWNRTVKIVTPFNLLGNLEPFNDLYASYTGVYFTLTTGNKIAFFSYATREVIYYTVPTPGSLPLAIYVGSDGFVYFTEVAAGKVGMLNPETGEIKEFFFGIQGSEIRAETPSGKKHPFIWITTALLNGVARFDPNTGQIKHFQNPLSLGLTSEDTVDGCDVVWVSSIPHNALISVNSKTGRVSYVTIPDTITLEPVSVPPFVVFAVNYGPGNAIWFNKVAFNQVGSYALDANCSMSEDDSYYGTK